MYIDSQVFFIAKVLVVSEYGACKADKICANNPRAEVCQYVTKFQMPKIDYTVDKNNYPKQLGWKCFYFLVCEILSNLVCPCVTISVIKLGYFSLEIY